MSPRRLARRRTCKALAALALLPPSRLVAQAPEPVVAFLSTESRSARATPGPLERELARRNPELAARVRYHYRFAEDDPPRLARLAAELVALHPTVLYCADFAAAKAAAQATGTIPIVFLAHVDPVGQRFLDSVRSSNRNITGVVTFRPVLVKLTELALDAFPEAKRIAVLLNTNELAPRESLPGMQGLARDRGVTMDTPEIARENDLLAWISGMDRGRYDVVVVTATASTWHQRRALVAALNRVAMPAVYEVPIFVDEGGLMCYGPSYEDFVPRVADYLERVLNGVAPSSLPILQPTRVELVINLKAARAQGISLPAAVLRRADRILQ